MVNIRLRELLYGWLLFGWLAGWLHWVPVAVWWKARQKMTMKPFGNYRKGVKALETTGSFDHCKLWLSHHRAALRTLHGKKDHALTGRYIVAADS